MVNSIYMIYKNLQYRYNASTERSKHDHQCLLETASSVNGFFYLSFMLLVKLLLYYSTTFFIMRSVVEHF